MRYKSFRIRNFKGIKDTTIELQGIAGANVFAFVGLNESGKTTVLEAIHTFNPDNATSELLGGETGVPFKERVPRHRISDFTGYVGVQAVLLLNSNDKKTIEKRFLSELKLHIDIDSLGDTLRFERQQKFQDGDLTNNYFSLWTPVLVRGERQRKWRKPEESELVPVRNLLYSMTPNIAYFPTFVFDFPESIYLTDRGGAVDQFYRKVFQDILDYDGRGHTIEKDIVRRVREQKMQIPWLSFLTAWGSHDDRDKIQHVMDRAGAAVTRLVFGRWNQIFGEDTKGKEVIISYEIVEGETTDQSGNKLKTESHDVLIKFQIRDGSRRFNVNDRSLGFRWFFSFMLFTQFRVNRKDSQAKPLLFLFDEPAANLHAAAQQKLIDSFPGISQGEHILAYSTHSHYMIEPKWLEQTFIVTNRADTPLSSVLDEISLDDESLDVKVTPYRAFVNAHPGQTSYFQPILDRLDVVPSKFDSNRASIVLEGKSDYYILRYAQNTLSYPELPLLPALGAGTFASLASLHIGWNLNFLFVLDGDKQGKSELERYCSEFGISRNRITTLDVLVPGIVEIEDLLDGTARSIIQSAIQSSKLPSKSQISRFFQERLASDRLDRLGDHFEQHSRLLLDELAARLTANS
jgi:hypothetical protein